MEKHMRIVCATTQAAAEVLQLLLAAGLHPGRDFEISPIFSTTPPIFYTVSTALSHANRDKIRAMADTTIIW
jgi:hypothetical protein